MVHRTVSVTRVLLVVLGSIFLAMPLAENGHACDTPVYRYAMYRWTPTPYEVYYFHEDFWQEQKYNANDTEVHKGIERLTTDKEAPANVVLLPVNVFADKDLRSVPPDVRKMWQKQEDKSLPKYMLVSPLGAHVYSGDLQTSELASLAMSPTRERIAGMLADGHAGVFLLLSGKDRAANDEAEQVLKGLAADVAAGKVELYKGPQSSFGSPAAAAEPRAERTSPQKQGESGQDKADKNAPQNQIGVATVARDDPKERWLVEMLLAVEPDLKDNEFEDQPMIFVVYGRGRALPPYIGKGITRDNMLEVLDFITSACSCTVKEQNPGVDLLSRYDWETAAEKLASRFGTEEGNEGFYAPDEFFPELIVGPGKTTADADQKETAVTSATAIDTGKTQETGAIDGGAVPNSEKTGQGNDSNVEPSAVETSTAHNDAVEPNASADEGGATSQNSGGREVAALTTDKRTSVAESETGEGDASTSNSWMYTLAIGLGVGLFMLIGASFLLFRNR